MTYNLKIWNAGRQIKKVRHCPSPDISEIAANVDIVYDIYSEQNCCSRIDKTAV